MQESYDYIKSLLEEKEAKISEREDKKKINELKSLFEIKDLFFRIDIETAIGILDYLGVPRNQIKGVYASLTSPEAFTKLTEKNYYGIDLK